MPYWELHLNEPVKSRSMNKSRYRSKAFQDMGNVRYENLSRSSWIRMEKTVIDRVTDVELAHSKVQVEQPKVVIPVFPGQNCEYDTTQKFERAGAIVKQVVFNNLSVEDIQESIDTLAKEIESQPRS